MIKHLIGVSLKFPRWFRPVCLDLFRLAAVKGEGGCGAFGFLALRFFWQSSWAFPAHIPEIIR